MEITSLNKNINIFKFISLSLLGIFLFMIPFPLKGELQIPIAILSNTVQDLFEHIIPGLVVFIIIVTAMLSLITTFFKPKFILNNHLLSSVFCTNMIWLTIRVLGAIFASCVFFNIGPEFIISENTGGLIFFELLPILFSIFFFAALFLPLLLSFGLLEFIGALLTNIMRPIFKLPGRASIDCITSWLGDGTIGILLTSKQYEEGYYTEREACVIGTAFSLVSITFSFVVINEVGLSHLFGPFYLIVTVACILAAILLPKFGPLSKKKDCFFNEGNSSSEVAATTITPTGLSSFKYGFESALTKASTSSIYKDVIQKGFSNIFEMWFAVLPVVMGIGTMALIVAEYTPVFSILGLPFRPILELLRVPEAAEASKTLVAGFADMLLPSILASSITSDLTRFIVAAVSISQLVYLSEVGAMILSSKIPLNFKELFIIFLQRTLITLPIIAILSHLLFKFMI